MTALQRPTVSSNELIKAWRKIWNEKEYTNIDSKKTYLLVCLEVTVPLMLQIC